MKEKNHIFVETISTRYLMPEVSKRIKKSYLKSIV